MSAPHVEFTWVAASLALREPAIDADVWAAWVRAGRGRVPTIVRWLDRLANQTESTMRWHLCCMLAEIGSAAAWARLVRVATHEDYDGRLFDLVVANWRHSRPAALRGMARDPLTYGDLLAAMAPLDPTVDMIPAFANLLEEDCTRGTFLEMVAQIAPQLGDARLVDALMEALAAVDVFQCPDRGQAIVEAVAAIRAFEVDEGPLGRQRLAEVCGLRGRARRSP